MKKLILTVELEYDDSIMHGTQPEDIAWFRNDVLLNNTDAGGLYLHSDEIGDEVGRIHVIDIKDCP